MSCVSTRIKLPEQPNSVKHDNASNSTHSFDYFKDFEFFINTHMIFFSLEIFCIFLKHILVPVGAGVLLASVGSQSIMQYVGRP